MNQAMGTKEWAALLATAAMFGSSFLLIKLAVETIPPATLAAGRAALAVPIAWLGACLGIRHGLRGLRLRER